MFAFSTVPIRAAAVLGAFAILLAVLFAVYSVWAKLFFDDAHRGFTALTLAHHVPFRDEPLLLGVIGEYVGRVYEEVKGRPLYVVSKVVKNGTAPDR